MNRAETSMQSNGTQIDLSLGSFASGFSTPARPLRKPSGSTATSSAPLSTPSPPTAAQFRRRRLEEDTPVTLSRRRSGLDDLDDADGGDVLDTPGQEKKWGDALDVSAPGRPSRTRSAGAKGGVNLTLRDQEKVCVISMSGVVRACLPRCGNNMNELLCSHDAQTPNVSYAAHQSPVAHRQP